MYSSPSHETHSRPATHLYRTLYLSLIFTLSPCLSLTLPGSLACSLWLVLLLATLLFLVSIVSLLCQNDKQTNYVFVCSAWATSPASATVAALTPTRITTIATTTRCKANVCCKTPGKVFSFSFSSRRQRCQHVAA